MNLHEAVMGWRWLVGSLKLQVSFAEYSLFYRALLQKKTYNFKEPTLYMNLHETVMGWLRLVGSFILQVSFAEYGLFYRALLQKRPIISKSLLIIWASQVAHVNTSCHTNVWVMSHIWIIHVTSLSLSPSLSLSLSLPLTFTLLWLNLHFSYFLSLSHTHTYSHKRTPEGRWPATRILSSQSHMLQHAATHCNTP